MYGQKEMATIKITDHVAFYGQILSPIYLVIIEKSSFCLVMFELEE